MFLYNRDVPFDWIVPHIKCRVIIDPYALKGLKPQIQWFDKRAVTIDKIDTVWDNDGAEISIALVKVDSKQLWAEYDWLQPLVASSECICPLKRLWNQGCKCGGK